MFSAVREAMFSIVFQSQINGAEKKAIGTITFGSSRETFVSSFHQWSAEDYQAQWLEAIKRIVDGEEHSALITNLPLLTSESLINWWTMWRFGDQVKFQDQLFFISDLSVPFDLDDPYSHVGAYTAVNDESQHVSEWDESVANLAVFLDVHS
ncbi:MAG: hypothetical protein ACRYFS_09855 [Janthinobacterium lividum]